MRPFLLLTIALTCAGIVASANAESTVPQERWEGYRSVDSSEVQNLNLPFQDFAENAVLDLETIGVTQTPGEKFEVVDVETIAQETDRAVLSNPRLRTHIQNKTIAASTHADRKMSARRSKRMAILRQSLSRPNMFSTLWRFL